MPTIRLAVLVLLLSFVVLAGILEQYGCCIGSSWVAEIDVNTCVQRTRRHFCGVLTDERVWETEFSRLVKEFGLDRTPPDWRKTHGGGKGLIGQYNAIGIYSGVSSAGKGLATRFRAEHFTVAEQRKAVSMLLRVARAGELNQLPRSVEMIGEPIREWGIRTVPPARRVRGQATSAKASLRGMSVSTGRVSMFLRRV